MLHADAMPQLRTKRLYRADVSQTHKDLTNDKYRDMRRPKKVTFFNNGDKFSKGKKLFITPHRYLSFQDLLGDLTNKLPSTSSLPYGVRQIYTPRGGRRIRDIEHLQDGQEYVCAGFESFKAMNYGTQALDPWSTGRPHRHTDNPSTIDLKGVSALPHPSSINQGLTPRHHFEAYPQRKPLRPLNDPYSLREDDRRYGAITKPKVITVVRAGRKPYANIKILLNRRSVQSYERLLNDISESFGPKWKNNKVRSLYTLTGREVLSISDFFRGDSIFVAVGNEKISFTDVQDIIETLYPDSTYAKTLLRNIEKQKRKAKQQMLQSLANDNQELLEKQGSEKPPPPAPSKKVVKRLPVEETSAEDAAETESNQKKTLPSKPGKRPAADSPRDEENEEKPKQSEKEPDATEDIEKPRPKKKIAKKVLQPKPTENAQPEKEEKATAEQEPDTPIEQVKDKTKKVQAQANSKRQLKEERQKEQERLLQEKRDAEAKAKAELYRLEVSLFRTLFLNI
ncbi:DCLK3 [Bugula neritina]|uniref:DCLK3 n=1 Tax=Bugula neritina TaxID=10212 RepID=A0A7J7K3G9_BUGNE|nr:DCLK3 [Bugula neritina]